MFQEKRIMGTYFLLSKFFWMNSFVFGSAGYPEPKSVLYFSFSLYTSSSRFSFARIEAAPTIGWLASALCSHFRIMFSGFSRSCFTSFDQAWMFTEGQSIIAVVFSFRFFVKWFMMSAVLIASR